MMYEDDLKTQYFEWMLDIIYNNAPFTGLSYDRLLYHMHTTIFRYRIPGDAHRYDDGLDLRRRFLYEHDMDYSLSDELSEIQHCSVLEMMIALAIRCEEKLMSGSECKIAIWFWDMVRNLGLNGMTDRRYDEEEVDEILNRFLDRQYSPDGHGGLFVIEDCDDDLRTVEIWYQMNWYLCDKYF